MIVNPPQLLDEEDESVSASKQAKARRKREKTVARHVVVYVNNDGREQRVS
jgi:hypothetical protein